MVRHSWQFGTAFFVTRSKKDLQSVIIGPCSSSLSEVSGLCRAKLGFFTYPHMHLIQVSLSSELDME